MLSIQDEAYKSCQEFCHNPICGFNHKDVTIQVSFQGKISPKLQDSLWKRKIISIIQTETDKIYSYNNIRKNRAGQIW